MGILDVTMLHSNMHLSAIILKVLPNKKENEMMEMISKNCG